MPCIFRNIGHGISIYIQLGDHPRPHVHLKKGGSTVAKMEIESFDLIWGRLNQSELGDTKRFMRRHSDELMRAWDLCERGIDPNKV